jgi:hypothetical protein
MHPQTFDIQEFVDEQKARTAGYTVPLSSDEAAELQGMNRKQRRAWLSQQRKAGKK